MMITRTLSTLMLALLLAACAETPTKPSAPVILQPPAWYLTPPTDTELMLFGAGAAKSREDAIHSALNDLSSKLGVEVSSQFKLQQKSTSGTYESHQQTTDKQILTEVQTTTLNQYQVVKTEQTGYDKFYALVKTDKSALSDAIRNRLQQQMSGFTQAEKLFLQSHQPGYLTWQFYDSEQQKLPTFERQVAILKTLKSNENTKPYKKYITSISNSYQVAKTRVKFFIHSKSSTATQLQPSLENQITASGFSLTTSASNSTDRVELQATEKSTQAYGFTIVRSQVTLTFYEGQKQLGSNQFTLKGQGLNKAQASINLQNDFKQQLKSHPLQQALGLKNE